MQCLTFESCDCSCRCNKVLLAPTIASMVTVMLPLANCHPPLANVIRAGLESSVIFLCQNFLPAPTKAFLCRWPLKPGNIFGSLCHLLHLLSALLSHGCIPWVTLIFTFNKAFRLLCHHLWSKALNVILAVRNPCPQQCCMLIPLVTRIHCQDCGLLVFLRLVATPAPPLYPCAQQTPCVKLRAPTTCSAVMTFALR